jgi:large subunit ribosomal protein L29
MKRLKTEELSKLSDSDLVKRLNDLRSELSRLRSSAARGTLKKELGEIKTVRRNIARTLTAMNAKESAPKTVDSKKVSPTSVATS